MSILDLYREHNSDAEDEAEVIAAIRRNLAQVGTLQRAGARRGLLSGLLAGPDAEDDGPAGGAPADDEDDDAQPPEAR